MSRRNPSLLPEQGRRAYGWAMGLWYGVLFFLALYLDVLSGIFFPHGPTCLQLISFVGVHSLRGPFLPLLCCLWGIFGIFFPWLFWGSFSISLMAKAVPFFSFLWATRKAALGPWSVGKTLLYIFFLCLWAVGVFGGLWNSLWNSTILMVMVGAAGCGRWLYERFLALILSK